MPTLHSPTVDDLARLLQDLPESWLPTELFGAVHDNDHGPRSSVASTEGESVRFDSVDQAIADIAAGKAVVVVDSADRENEGDLVFAAELASTELMAFMVRYTSGFVCAPLSAAECDRLGLPAMCARNEDRHGTAYTVTVDARDGVSTGISARDRAHTVRLLSDATATADDFTRPGHVVPLRAADGGVLERPGHTEAAVDLARLAGLRPAGVICEIVSEQNPSEMAKSIELRAFADEHGLAMISIDDLIGWRREHGDAHARRGPETIIPTAHGVFTAIGFTGEDAAADSVALVYGGIDAVRDEDVLVRVHSECLTGDAFGSLRCDCGPQLQAAMQVIAAEGRGIIVYQRGHEGRGIGLINKLRAYALQDAGVDTVDANVALGLPAEARDYGLAARILRELGVRSIRLLSNNPSKFDALAQLGVRITARVSLAVEETTANSRYLCTKRDRMGHALENLSC